jgi:hypothetical protein
MSIDDMETLVEAVGKRLEGSSDKLKESVDMCDGSRFCKFKVKCAVGVNRYS